MANAAVASWTACIKELQKLVVDPSTSHDTADLAVGKLDKDKEIPLPNAAWKKLVRDVKVLLSTACCSEFHNFGCLVILKKIPAKRIL